MGELDFRHFDATLSPGPYQAGEVVGIARFGIHSIGEEARHQLGFSGTACIEELLTCRLAHGLLLYPQGTCSKKRVRREA